ncbi:MAG: hypothetical protein M3Q07_13755 [Pseudobdellovibrionaceae bacterium]|nr:hypothetical protein [Pseudobdellovibrionaceae bacterium]
MLFASECAKSLYDSAELTFELQSHFDGNIYRGFINIDDTYPCQEGVCVNGRMVFNGFGTYRLDGYYNGNTVHLHRECPGCTVGSGAEQHYNGFCGSDLSMRGDFADANGTVKVGVFTFKRL